MTDLLNSAQLSNREGEKLMKSKSGHKQKQNSHSARDELFANHGESGDKD